MTASGATIASVICARFSEPSEWADEIIRDRDLVAAPFSTGPAVFATRAIWRSTQS